ncbi:nuclear transport factor 2 family protein [Lentzea sp.]|uniref:nuclear transport factor 2 family protein n=1 Tax=Lentzea sp. TaxID=56099 RepID=UPI002ED57CB2
MAYDEIMRWFEQWDALAKAGDVEAMADMALFPINTVTGGSAASWDRETFLREMGAQLGGDVEMESTRTPHFLDDDLVFVITDGTINGTTVRYGDLLTKVGGEWKFQTMAQGGWA